MDVDINAIVERIQDASELSYNYYKPLVDRIIAENAYDGFSSDTASIASHLYHEPDLCFG